MSRRNAFTQLVLARVREFFREPEAVFWVYGFPILLAVGLGVAFSSSQPEPPYIDVVGDANLLKTLQDQGLKAESHTLADSEDRLKKGKTALYLVVNQAGLTYSFDPARSEGMLARKWVEAAVLRAAIPTPPVMTEKVTSEPGSRYIDFLMPGLMGMNIMGGGLFGVGFVLVDMRVRKLFKRLMATPMHRGDFLLSMLTARLVFLLPEMLALLLVARIAYGVPINGSWLVLLLTILVGAFAFSGLGLLLGSRTEKTETMSGLMNLIMLPMWLLSGIFFSSERFPGAMQPFIQALPLTQLNNALREVMLEGAGVLEIWLRLAILAAWALVTFGLALRWFKWR